MKNKLFFLASLGLLWVNPAYCEQWNFGGYIGQANFDNEAAQREYVENSALTLGGYAEFQSDSLLALTMGVEYLSYDDNAEFSQWVVAEYLFDDDETYHESSDAYAFSGYVDAGPRWQFGTNKNSYFTVAAGFNTALVSERAIPNCRNCRSEDIEIDGGGYIKLAVGAKAGAVNLGLLYRQFFSGDYDNAVYITIGSGF
ncbi:MAG: hypothetical protein JXA04_02950 [Gammaproteobacteria bacterium]|nr:hypothetical protein [Gammaproteobacteria bacterium]